jgi:regulatory protein
MPAKSPDPFSSALASALRYLSYRPRTEAEVRQKLLSRFPKGVTEQVIRRLHALGLLNDREFTRLWVEQRQRSRPRGKRLLHQELARKGVAKAVIEEALASTRDEEAAYQAGRRKAATLSASDFRGFRNKLGPYLQRRGFSYEIAKQAVERLWRERSATS